MKIFLVRHALSTNNRREGKRVPDPPLSDVGLPAIKYFGSWLNKVLLCRINSRQKEQKTTRILLATSPMLRAVKTLQYILLSLDDEVLDHLDVEVRGDTFEIGGLFHQSRVFNIDGAPLRQLANPVEYTNDYVDNDCSNKQPLARDMDAYAQDNTESLGLTLPEVKKYLTTARHFTSLLKEDRGWWVGPEESPPQIKARIDDLAKSIKNRSFAPEHTTLILVAHGLMLQRLLQSLAQSHKIYFPHSNLGCTMLTLKTDESIVINYHNKTDMLPSEYRYGHNLSPTLGLSSLSLI